SHMPVAERAKILLKLSAAIREHAQAFAFMQSEEVGSPYSLTSTMMAELSAATLDYYINLATAYPFEEVRSGMMGKTLVLHEPVGVVGAIVPWNVPLPLSFFKLAPALLAGCSVVLKPAPEAPLYAYLLAEVLQESGLPSGVVNIVPAGREVGEH